MGGQHKVNLGQDESDEDGLNDRSGKPAPRKKGQYTNPWDLEVTGRAGGGIAPKRGHAKLQKNEEEVERKIEEGFEKVLSNANQKPEQTSSPKMSKGSKPLILPSRVTNKPLLKQKEDINDKLTNYG